MLQSRGGRRARLAFALATAVCTTSRLASVHAEQDAPPSPESPPASASRPATRFADANAKPDVARLFAELAHPDAPVREAARVKLMGLSSKALPELQRQVQANLPLAPAQAVVLREIVTHLYLANDSYPSSTGGGFLGVLLGEVHVSSRHDAEGENDGGGDPIRPPDPNPFARGGGGIGSSAATTGVVIVDRMPGFCGARTLRDGDVILGIVESNGIPIRSITEIRAAVLTFGAGQTIHFQLLRQGQVIRVPIKLDPRPDDADAGFGVDGMKSLLERRKSKAEEYWQQNFAPILKQRVG